MIVIKSRRMRWAVYVTCLRMRNAFRILVRKLEVRDCLGYLDIDGRIIFKWILRKQYEGMDWIQLA
jgi:hypothetical protein